MKISVSSYSFQKDINSKKITQFDTIAKAKEIGFSGIEFIEIEGETYDIQLKNAKKYREEADRLGLDIVAYAVRGDLYKETPLEIEKEIEKLKRHVDLAEVLKVPIMRHDVCYNLGKTGNSRSFNLMLPTIAKGVIEVSEYAKTKNIKTCTENHGFIAQDSYRIEQLFNMVNNDNYGILIDFGNFICVDENPITAVSRLAPYAIHCHAKDMLVSKKHTKRCHRQTRGGNYFGGVTLSKGVIPVKKCLQIMKRVEYNGYITLEYEGYEDCNKGITKGFKKLKKYISQL